MILTGKSLGERQQDLNVKVNNAFKTNVDFNNVKAETEKSDVDRLFKIDLASKYKNIDYIVEVLKSGDSLYISRALKCHWIYDDEYAAVINTDYIHHNIFPFMSKKMKNKFLSTISMHIRNENRCASFYMYCISLDMMSIALKFLIFTNESFKLDLLITKIDILNFDEDETGYLKHFVGNSFTLSEAYLKEVNEHKRIRALYILRYLYSVSDVKYLDLLEKYASTEVKTGVTRLGLRISKDIMKKFKDRTLKHPLLYIKFINIKMLCKYSTSNDAKLYAVALLPPNSSSFWANNYCERYKFILNLILSNERYVFVKKIFTDKYPKEPFEMTSSFYNLEYYKMMPEEEKEAWALRHLENQEELLGTGNDYIWYKFVNFEKALVEIKKYIMITPDHIKRAKIIKILVESAKNQRELVKLLNYYYERHVNEITRNKEMFLDKVIHTHNVFEFDSDCWMAFNKLLYSIEVYNPEVPFKHKYRNIALIYHIIHSKDLPDGLKHYLNTSVDHYMLKSFANQLSEDKAEHVYQYVLQFYVEKIKEFDAKPYNDDVKVKVRKYIRFILDLARQFKKIKEGYIEIVLKYMKLDFEEFESYLVSHEESQNINEAYLIRLLKQDANLVVSNLPAVKQKMTHSYLPYRLNQLLRKLRIYFLNDIAKDYLNFFIQSLSEPLRTQSAYGVVNTIFQLADENYKISFMTKYVPPEPKIDHINVDSTILLIRESICRFAYYSRPPVPLTNLLMYIKGDYLQYCLPMFNSYLSNLPQQLCIKFVGAILDTPLSVQKHGIRLAFKCFNAEDLKKLILNIWKKTKNVSLRMILYKALFDKILNENAIVQIELFEILKEITLDLNQDDNEGVFELLLSVRLPKDFKGDYLESAWKSISKLPDKPKYLNWKCRTISNIERNINLVKDEVVRPIIDEHLHIMMNEKGITHVDTINEIQTLNRSKWELVACYIVNIDDKDKEKLEKNLMLLEFIMKKCFEMWNEVFEDTYVVRQFFSEFINDLEDKGYSYDERYKVYTNLIFENILKGLQDAFPLQEIYMTIWNIRLTILVGKVLHEGRNKIDHTNKVDNDIVLRELIISYTSEVGKVVKEFVEKNVYFTSFLYDFIDQVKKNVQTILRNLHLYKNNFKEDDLLVFAAVGLIYTEISECYLLALKILPTDYLETSEDDYKNVVTKLKMCDNSEIQCSLYQKFINNFKRRKYV